MTEIQIQTKTWNDLKKRELLLVYPLAVQVASDISPKQRAAFLLEIFFNLTGLSRSDFWFAGEDLEEDDALVLAYEMNEVIVQALQHIIQPNEDQDKPWIIQPGLTKCPFAELKIRQNNKVVSWYAPATGLDNLTIYELGAIFTHLESYHSAGNEALCTMLATMYRPSKPKTIDNIESAYAGDRRLPYRGYEATVDSRAKRWYAMDKVVIALLTFWVTSCRAAFMKEYPRVFKTKVDEPEREGNDYGWGGVLLSLSGGIANLNAVADTNAHTVFTYLSQLEDQRLEREMWGK
jgi:hypothetical protein